MAVSGMRAREPRKHVFAIILEGLVNVHRAPVGWNARGFRRVGRKDGQRLDGSGMMRRPREGVDDGMGQRVKLGIEGVVATALVLGAAGNLAAGARRPLVERAILSSDHYAYADRAAQAVQRSVPAGEPLQVVVYDGDTLDELDAAVWFDFRAKWLLYPRRILLTRVDPNDPSVLRAAPGTPPPADPAARYPVGSYVLFFRASAAPVLPALEFERLAEERMWVLARRTQRSGG